MTPEDRAAIEAIVGKHMQCLGEKTALYIAGSNDVAFLVKHIVSLCDPVLDELNQAIQDRGFSPYFSNGYVRTSREEGVKVTTSFILKEKAKLPQ